MPTRRIVLAAAAAGLVALPLVAGLPQDTLLWRELHDAAHAPVFAAVAILLLLLRAPSAPGAHRRPRDYLRAFVLAAALGALTELIQVPLARDASLGDLGRDCAGALAGLGLAALVGRLRGAPGGWRPMLAAAGVLAGLAVSAPVAWTAIAYVERARQLPQLYAFDRAPVEVFIGGGSPTQRERTTWQGAPALRVVLGAEEYAGVTLEEPWPDWRGAQALVLELANPSAEPLPLTLRVHDRWHDQRFDDRWNRSFELPPGTHRLRFPLAEIEAGPRGRRLDLGAVAGLVLFAVRPPPGREFYVLSVALDAAAAQPPSAAAGGPAAAAAATLGP